MLHIKDKIDSNEVYFIAEMSANHAGKLENALRIVREAANSGADCIKIQTYTADTITIDCRNEYFTLRGGLWDNYNLYDLYKEAYTPWEWQKRIKEECDSQGIDFISTPFDSTAVDFLEEIGCEAYKIASFEIVDIPLIRYVASKKKPLIISCGMATKEEIEDALMACYSQGNKDVYLLKCCSEYPTNPQNLNLSTINDMIKRYDVPIGLSDHSMGYLADVIAASYGASIIEKHFCLDRGIKNADSTFSMEPLEFKEMTDAVKEAVIMRGKVTYGPLKGEMDEFKCRRSIFAVKDIKKGDTLSFENIRSIRPNDGISPKYLDEIIGRRAKCNINFGTPLKWNYIDDSHKD